VVAHHPPAKERKVEQKKKEQKKKEQKKKEQTKQHRQKENRQSQQKIVGKKLHAHQERIRSMRANRTTQSTARTVERHPDNDSVPSSDPFQGFHFGFRGGQFLFVKIRVMHVFVR
jgi:ATPase subunit of ABC transporter with duplicated ATPase domains